MRPLRIMSANLYQGRVRPAVLAAALDEVAPDVLCTQELDPSAAAVIEDRFRHVFLDPRYDARGLGIATELDVEFQALPMPLRHGRSALVDVEGERLEVVTIHLANPVDRPWRRTARIRAEQLAAVERHLAGSGWPAVIVGDMNASPAWPAYRRLAASFRDLARDVSDRPARTWSYRHPLPRVLRIDHAFGRGVAATVFRTVRLPRSDHDAIVVDVVMRAPRRP